MFSLTLPSLLGVARLRAASARAGVPKASLGTDVSLYIKAGPDGESIGDCPFAHGVRILLEAKGIPCDIVPRGPDNKPDWLLDSNGGKMPALRVDGEVVQESRSIADWVEARVPSPSLAPPELAAAEEAASALFPAFAKYVKNVDDDAADVELKKGLTLALCNLDAYLSKSGKYRRARSSASPTASCCRSSTTCAKSPATSRATRCPEQFEALEQYMYAGSDLMYAVAPTPAMVRWGWSVARGEPASVVAAMAGRRSSELTRRT